MQHTSASASERVVRRPGFRPAGAFQKDGQITMFKKATQEDADKAVGELKKELSQAIGEERAVNWLNWLTTIAENKRGKYNFMTIIGAFARACSVVKMTLKTVSHPARNTTLRVIVNDSYAEHVDDLFNERFFEGMKYGVYRDIFEHKIMKNGQPLLDENGKEIWQQHLVLYSQFDFDKKATPLSEIVNFAFDLIERLNSELHLQSAYNMLEYREMHSDSESVHSYDHSETSFPELPVSDNTADGATANTATADADAVATVTSVATVATATASVVVSEATPTADPSTTVTKVKERWGEQADVATDTTAVATTATATGITPVANTVVPGAITSEVIVQQENFVEALKKQLVSLQRNIASNEKRLIAMRKMFEAQLAVAEFNGWTENAEEL